MMAEAVQTESGHDQDRNELVHGGFVDDVDIPGFIDAAAILVDNGHDDNDTGSTADRTTATRHSPTTPGAELAAGGLALPDWDGVVISVFAVAVILLFVGQAVVVYRHRHQRSCRRRSRKWNVPVFDHQMNHRALHSPPPSEVWTALPSSPLSDLFHADNYRTPAFAYINRRSMDSLTTTQRLDSRSSGSSRASSTPAFFVPRPRSVVTWSDVGEITSSSPEKRRPGAEGTSPSLTSSPSPATLPAAPGRLDAEVHAEHRRQLPASYSDDELDDVIATSSDDVIVTSSASIDCSTLRDDDDEVEVDVVSQCQVVGRRRSYIHSVSDDVGHGDAGSSESAASSPAPTRTLSKVSSIVHYLELISTKCTSTSPESAAVADQFNSAHTDNLSLIHI